MNETQGLGSRPVSCLYQVLSALGGWSSEAWRWGVSKTTRIYKGGRGLLHRATKAQESGAEPLVPLPWQIPCCSREFAQSLNITTADEYNNADMSMKTLYILDHTFKLVLSVLLQCQSPPLPPTSPELPFLPWAPGCLA